MGYVEPARKARGIVGVRADASGDVKAVLAEMSKAFEDFKAANDERLAGKADVVVDERVDRINAAVTELQVKMDAAVKEQQARLDDIEAAANRLRAGGDGGTPPVDIRAQCEAFLAGKQGVAEVKVDDSDIAAYQEYQTAFAKMLRRGDRSAGINAALQVGSDPDGGYWVPKEMSDRVITRLFDTSPMRQLASVTSITTDSIGFPNDVNDGTSGGFVGETEPRTETATPQVGEQTIYVREQWAEPRATQKLLDMASINVEAWLDRKIADKMRRVENARFVSGTGVLAPRGFLDYRAAAVTTADASRAWGVLQYVPTGAAGGFPAFSGIAGADDPGALIDIIAALKPEYRSNANWTMNRLTEAAIRKLKDAEGRYLIGMGDLQDGATGFMLLRYPIVNLEDMPDAGADSFSAAFGDFEEGYQIVDGRGIRILRDPYTTKGWVKFYTTKWTGGDVTNFDAIKLLKFGNS